MQLQLDLQGFFFLILHASFLTDSMQLLLMGGFFFLLIFAQIDCGLIDSAFKTFALDLQAFFFIKALENLDRQFSTWCLAEIDCGGLIFPNSNNNNYPKSICQGK